MTKLKKIKKEKNQKKYLGLSLFFLSKVMLKYIFKKINSFNTIMTVQGRNNIIYILLMTQCTRFEIC